MQLNYPEIKKNRKKKKKEKKEKKQKKSILNSKWSPEIEKELLE